MLHVASICTPSCMLLSVLGSCCAKLKPVKLWATMLGVVGSVCTLLKKGWHFMVQELVQILLNLIWVETFRPTSRTKPNLEGFVWTHQKITGLISQRQFARNANFWQVGVLDVGLSGYLDKSHNFRFFYDVTL